MTSYINQIDFPKNKKGVKSSICEISFLKIFIQNFGEMLKKITDMLKKNVEIKWITYANTSFK